MRKIASPQLCQQFCANDPKPWMQGAVLEEAKVKESDIHTVRHTKAPKHRSVVHIIHH